jgi:hypothetical protein
MWIHRWGQVRSAEPTFFSQTVFYLLIAGLASLVIIYFVRHVHLRRRRHREFLEYGHKLGLQDSEILFLRKIGLREKMKNPLRLLTSVTMFDRHVGAFAGRLAAKNLEHPLLDDIASIRQAMNFDAVPETKTLNSTRQIEKGQSLLAWQGADVVEGFSPWLVVKRNEGALPLVPILEGDRGYFTDLKVGDPISARFWRQGDTEYRFDTHVARVEAQAPTCCTMPTWSAFSNGIFSALMSILISLSTPSPPKSRRARAVRGQKPETPKEDKLVLALLGLRRRRQLPSSIRRRMGVSTRWRSQSHQPA